MMVVPENGLGFILFQEQTMKVAWNTDQSEYLGVYSVRIVGESVGGISYNNLELTLNVTGGEINTLSNSNKT